MQTDRIPVKDLLLDSANPRLASVSTNGSQDGIVRLLWDEMAVDEVALSIAANGFFEEEPLVVTPDRNKGKYVVLEGNRRLAAVRILTEDDLRAKVRASNLPVLTENQKKRLEKLPVSIYRSREEIWQYYGFRHINGPKPWDPYSKAQFIAQVHEQQKKPLDEIAESIGDRHNTVQRLYRGYVVLRQAEQGGYFNREDRIKNRFNFNYLYTALDQPDYQKFLGVDAKNSLKPDPVPETKREQLREFLIWLYGSKSDRREPLIKSQSDDLKMLRMVIVKPQALSALRKWNSLERAYEVGIGDKQRLLDATTAAKEALLIANGTVTTGYSGEDDLYNIVKDIVDISQKILEEMNKKRTSKPRRK